MASGFLVLISFFTRIPIGKRIEYNEESFKKSLSLFTLMGAIIGILLALVGFVGNIFQNIYIRGLTITLSYIAITGGIHLDGTADSTDGLFSGRTGDRIFEIMSDSHIGSFGVISLIIIILSQFVLFSYSDIYTCFLVPVAGRASVIISCVNKKYAKKDKGMGTVFIESIDEKTVIINILILVLCCFIVPNSLVLLLSSFFTLAFAFLISIWIENKIGGMTGDTCGFIVEVCQVIFLIAVFFYRGIL